MTDLQCKYFLNLVKTKSMTRCAQEYFVSPPAVSQQISLLEKEFGAPLFIRSPRGMELTAEGSIVYNCCLSRQAALDNAMQRLRRLQTDAQAPTIPLGLREGWPLPRQMFQLRSLLQRVAPHSRLDIHSLPLSGGLACLESGKLDAFICLGGDRELLGFPEGVAYHTIAQLERVFLFSALYPTEHALLSPADFSILPLLCLAEVYQTHAQFDNIMCCNSLGFTPSVVIPKDSMDDALLAAAMGDGFFIGDRWLYPLWAPAFSFLPLGIFHTVQLIWMDTNRNPLLERLIYLCTHEVNWNPDTEFAP